MEEEYILDGKTYTASQLNQYAKQSNLSLKDYIYESGATIKKTNKYMLDGKTYTDVQLNQYAKQSNLSLKDYIYESGATALKKKNSLVSATQQTQKQNTTELPSEDGSLATLSTKNTALTFGDKVRQAIPEASNLTTADLNNANKKKVTDMSGRPLVPEIKKEDKQLLKNIYQENQDLEAEKKKFEDIFDTQLNIKPKVEESKYLKDRLNDIDTELINKTESFVVTELQYQFGDLGFKFEEARAGRDYVKAIAPNGKTIEISLDNWFDKTSESESKVLQKFIKENTPAKGLFVIEKTMREQDKKFNSEKQVDDSIKVISEEVTALNAKQKQFLLKKSSFEKALEMYSSSADKNTIDLLEQQRLALNEEMKSILEEEDRIKSRGRSLDIAVGKYSISKSKQGSWGGAIWNSINRGFSNISAGTVNLFTDISTEIAPAGFGLSPKDLKNVSIDIAKKIGVKGPSENQTVDQWKATLTEDKLDEWEDQVDDYIKKDLKSKILPYIRIGNTELVGDATTTAEFADLKEQGFFGGGILGLTKSLPAMIGGSGPVGWAQRTAQMYAQISDGLTEEMEKDPSFASISESEKLLITLPISITSALLEAYGLRNILASKGVITSLTMSALGRTGAGVTAKTFRELVENEVKSKLAKGLLTITAAGVAEFETGAAQEVTEVGFKTLYDNIKGKDMFDTPDSKLDLLYDILRAGGQEAIGGFVMGVPSGISAAYSKKGFLKMDNASFEAFAAIANDDKIQSSYIATLKQKIIQGLITEKQAKAELNNYRNSVGLYRQLPDGLTTEQQKEAMNLLKEKRDLNNFIEGKDDALVVKQKNRITEINDELTKLSETEVTEGPTLATQGIPDEISQPIELSVNETPVVEPQGIPDEVSQPIELSVTPEAPVTTTQGIPDEISQPIDLSVTTEQAPVSETAPSETTTETAPSEEKFIIDGKEYTQEEAIDKRKNRTSIPYGSRMEYSGNNPEAKEFVDDYNRDSNAYNSDGNLKENYMYQEISKAFQDFNFRKFGNLFRKHIDPNFKRSNNDKAVGGNVDKNFTWEEQASYTIGDRGYSVTEEQFKAFAKDAGITIPELQTAEAKAEAAPAAETTVETAPAEKSPIEIQESRVKSAQSLLDEAKTKAAKKKAMTDLVAEQGRLAEIKALEKVKAETAPETKAEVAPVETTTDTAVAEKKIAEATKKLADKVREIKVSRPDVFSSGTPGSLAWDLGVEAVAKSIEISGDIAQAVSDGLEAIKKTDWYKGLDNDKKTAVEDQFKNSFNTFENTIDSQGIQAIANGSSTMKDFFDDMSTNEDFNNLSESEKESFYYDSVSAYSTSQAISQEEESRKTIILKDQNWIRKLLNTFQNKMIRVKDVQDQISSILGTKILNEANVALKFELLVGKTKNVIDNIRYEISDRKNKNSFFNRLISDGGVVDDFGMYLYALHASERNESVSNKRKEDFDNEVAVLNQKIQDAKSPSLKTRYQNQLDELIKGNGKVTMLQGPGSGMTNEQAQDIIDIVEKSGKKDLYDNYAKEFRDKVITPNLDAMLKYELIDQETYDLVKNKYTNYVPLQVVEKSLNKVSGFGTKGANVKGRDIFKAKGSDLYKYTDRYNPVFSSLFAYSTTIMRGERNLASQSLIKLAELDVNNDVFKIHKPKYLPIIDSNGDISFLTEGTSDVIKKNSIELKYKGKPIYVEIKDKVLRDALNEQGIVRGIRGLHIVNTWLRNTATLLNPDFIATNFIRDIQGAAFNIQSSKKDLDIKKITRKIVNPKNLFNAGRGLISASNKDFNSEWAIAAKELADNGGVVSWFQAESLDEYINDLKKDVLKIKNGEKALFRALNKTKDTLLAAQLVAEQSVRLSTFKALKDAGVSLEEAAREAKNITVNFENKGTWSGFVDSLYLFATAGISGTVRTAYTLGKSKRARQFAAGIFTYGILESVLNNALASGDDEDEKVSDGIKERNLVLINPSDPSAEPLLMPLAYGLNVFKHAGNLTYDVSMGRKTVLEGSTKLFKSIYTTISPFQGPTMGQAISPTMLDPIVQHLENKNFLGNPIKPEQPKFGPKVKESDLYFKSSRITSKWAAKKLNEITGGNAVEKGYIDISPEILDHYYDGFTGGTGKFISNTVFTAQASINEFNGALYGEDEKISLRRLPFIKSFFGSKPSESDLNYIYEIYGKSATEEISEKDMIKFIKVYKKSRKEGLLDEENGRRITKELEKGQRKIKEYKGIQDLKLEDMNKKQRLEYEKNKSSN